MDRQCVLPCTVECNMLKMHSLFFYGKFPSWSVMKILEANIIFLSDKLVAYWGLKVFVIFVTIGWGIGLVPEVDLSSMQSPAYMYVWMGFRWKQWRYVVTFHNRTFRFTAASRGGQWVNKDKIKHLLLSAGVCQHSYYFTKEIRNKPSHTVCQISHDSKVDSCYITAQYTIIPSTTLQLQSKFSITQTIPRITPPWQSPWATCDVFCAQSMTV